VIGSHTAGTGADRSKPARRPAEYNRPVDRYEYPDGEARGTRSSSATPSSGRAGVQVHEPEGGFGTSSSVCWPPGGGGIAARQVQGAGLSTPQSQVPRNGVDHAGEHRGVRLALPLMVRGGDRSPDLGPTEVLDSDDMNKT
jgi:hypothetical protein